MGHVSNLLFLLRIELGTVIDVVTVETPFGPLVFKVSTFR